MAKYRVQGWILCKIRIDQELNADNLGQACSKIYTEYSSHDIQDNDLTAELIEIENES